MMCFYYLCKPHRVTDAACAGTGGDVLILEEAAYCDEVMKAFFTKRQVHFSFLVCLPNSTSDNDNLDIDSVDFLICPACLCHLDHQCDLSTMSMACLSSATLRSQVPYPCSDTTHIRTIFQNHLISSVKPRVSSCLTSDRMFIWFCDLI